MGNLEKRFRRKCRPQPSGCTEWDGWHNNRGYGCLRKTTKPYGHLLAHRVSYELDVGPIPEGMQVLHRCDNRGCVNPDHLFLGTQQENIDDMFSKGRQKTSRYNEVDLERMRDMYANGLTQREIALNFGCSRPMICLLLNGKAQPASLRR